MNQHEQEAFDRELRRHFTGIAAAALEGLHLWLSAEQLIVNSPYSLEGAQRQVQWEAITEHFTSVIDLLTSITNDQDGPTQLLWVQWRLQLAKQIGELNTRVDYALFPF